MSVVSNALKILNSARAKLDDVGLCPFSVTVRVRTWDGERVGVGNSADIDTALTVARGKRPRVELVEQKDVVAPGAPIAKATYVIGPLTPIHAGGGTPLEAIHPALAPRTTEIFYILTGPGTPPTGLLCKKVKEDLSNPFRYMLTIESLGMPA